MISTMAWHGFDGLFQERFEEVSYWEEKMAEVKKKITRGTSDKDAKTMDR